MKSRIVLILCFLVAALLACSQEPSQSAVETAIAKTHEAKPTEEIITIVPKYTVVVVVTATPEPPTSTPAITDTPNPTNTLESTDTPIPSPTPAPTTEPNLSGAASCIPSPAQLETGKVTSVIDGDTIEVLIGAQVYSVRYIGINTPETHNPETGVEYYGPEATEKNREYVEGEEIILVKDTSETDQYGRLLRYIFVGGLDGTFVNYELVAQGYAKAVSYPPDVACYQTFQEAENNAIAEKLGLWGYTAPTATVKVGEPATTGNIAITHIFYNGSGQNEPDEYVVIQNYDSQPIRLKGWTLEDKANHRFGFPDYVMQPGQVCRIYTNEEHPDTCGFSFHFSKSAIWNNGGDCAYLKDANHALIDQYCY